MNQLNQQSIIILVTYLSYYITAHYALINAAYALPQRSCNIVMQVNLCCLTKALNREENLVLT